MSTSRRRLTILLTTLAATAALSVPAVPALAATTAPTTAQHNARTAGPPSASQPTSARHNASAAGSPSPSQPTSARHNASAAGSPSPSQPTSSQHNAGPASPPAASPTASAPGASTSPASRPAASTPSGPVTPTPSPSTSGYQPLPELPVNACQDSTLPQDYGTNFPTPADPNGYGFYNQSVIGWEGNYYAPFGYLSGSYFARGVPQHYTQSGTTYCGAMYSFGAYNYGLAAGQAPAPGSVKWTMADGYLPALTTSFTRDNVAISITDFADKQTIAGNPAELVYTRVSVTNHGSSAVTVPAGQSGPNLVPLNQAPDTVPAGATVHHDFVAAVDTFGSGNALPPPGTLSQPPGQGGAPPYQLAFSNMVRFWTGRLSVIPRLSLPNTALPNTGGLADPGNALDDAYKAAFVYTRIVQVGKAPFSGANNYDWLLNHDLPGILANRFQLGDFTDAQNLLLTGRISEDPNFNEQGANWYWDGPWRTPLAWADYLETTNDTAFVSKYFHDDASGAEPVGPEPVHAHAHRLPEAARRQHRLSQVLLRQ